MDTNEVWFESRGTRLFAVECGAGTPLVLLHGALADHRAALSAFGFGAEVPPGVRLIAPDLRGSGRSIDPGPLAWDQLAEDVRALLDHLKIDRAIAGGISSGSGVAVRFALMHPGRTAGLVIVTPVHGGGPLTEAQAKTFAMIDALGQRAPTEGAGVLRPLYDRLLEPVRSRALAAVEGFDGASVAATTALLASGLPPLSDPSELSRIQAPALLIPGNDDLHPAPVSAIYAANLGRCASAGALDAASLASLGTTGAFVDLGDGLRGFYARPAGAGPFPAVLIFIEAYGLNAHFMRLTERFARAGFAAITPDIFGGATYDYGDLATAVAHLKRLDDGTVMAQANQALDFLAGRPEVRRDGAGVIGFCMGGRYAFLANAVLGARVKAVSAYYGGGIAPAQDFAGRKPLLERAGEMKAPIHLRYGAEDRFILPDEHARIAEALGRAKVEYTLAVYPGATHGFFCEDRGSYNREVAERSWRETIAFFTDRLH
jgi:carboxymethylenebutenolidase